MRVIHDEAEIAAAQASLLRRFEEAATQRGRHKHGHHGGAVEGDTGWISERDLWYAYRKLENRYWNGFGRGNPFADTGGSIVVEIDPPLAGVDRNTSGVFLRDDGGKVLLAHRGRIGGGKKGIGKNAILAAYEGDAADVDDGDRTTAVLPIAGLEDADLIEKIDSFVGSVQDFNDTATDAPVPGRTAGWRTRG
jgi:5-methylcytosine-specific restriction protein A